MFIIELIYKADLARIDAHMRDHMRFINAHYASGRFVVSGRKVPRDGGIIMAVGTDLRKILSDARVEPARKCGNISACAFPFATVAGGRCWWCCCSTARCRPWHAARPGTCWCCRPPSDRSRRNPALPTRSIKELIRSSREPIHFVEVSVQAARASGEAPDVSIAQRIRFASGSHRLDLVITIGGPAATFAQQFRQELFPATPMLIAGVDRRFVENGTFTDNETTVATHHDPALMIDEILRLLPETRTVMVVVGASQVEQFWLQEMKREFRRFDGRLQFIWTNELSFDEIVERSRTMPAQSAIFFAILSLDGKGEPRVEADAVDVAPRRSQCADVRVARQLMGRGIVGGPMLSADELSRTTTQVALRVLAGESPGSIKTPTQRTGQPTYDARELRRWKIDEGRLPPASVVLFREPTIWQRYQRPITFGALLGGIPVVAIVLLVGLIKRRRAQSRGPVAKDVLTPGPADATVRVWTAGADGQRVEAGHAPGAAQHDSWTAFVHPDDVERCREIYRRALERREPFQMEYRVREADGVERWILDTGTRRGSPGRTSTVTSGRPSTSPGLGGRARSCQI